MNGPDRHIRVVVLPAGRGLAWLLRALLILRSGVWPLLLLGLLAQLLAGLTQVGAIGILFVLCGPALNAGLLQALWITEQGRRPGPGTLFAAFREPARLPRLILLGVLMLVTALAAVMVVLSGSLAGLDQATLVRLEQGDVEALLALDPLILERVLLALVAGLLISGTLTYFAVPLIWFHGAPLGQAIVSGLAGMLRNWKPLLVLGLLLGVLAVPAGLLSGLALGLGVAGAGSSLLSLLMLFVAVVYQLLLFATQYASFAEVFASHPADSSGAKPDGNDQLVA